jgi:DNA topoisomerase-1
LRDFGTDPATGKPVVAKDGKFGTYVTDGETNASLTRGDRLEHMSPERAFELLAARRANPPEPGQTEKSPGTKTAPPKIEPPKTEHTKPKKKPARKRSKPKKAKKSFD